MIEKVITCPMCEKVYTVEITEAEAWAYFYNGQLVQHAFPDRPKRFREYMITGICDDCQDEIFGKDSEEDLRKEMEEIERRKQEREYRTLQQRAADYQSQGQLRLPLW